MILKIGSRATFDITDLKHASEIYARERDASGEGASTFPDGHILHGNLVVARVSYNAKIWRPGPFNPSQKPLFSPYP